MTTPKSDPRLARKRSVRKKSDPAMTLDRLIALLGLDVKSAERPEEMRSRLAIEKKRAEHELWRDRLVLRFSLVAFSVVGVGALLILIWPGQSHVAQTWASSTLAAITSGLVGFALGKSNKA